MTDHKKYLEAARKALTTGGAEPADSRGGRKLLRVVATAMAEAVEDAIAAERERCARIVEGDRYRSAAAQEDIDAIQADLVRRIRKLGE